MEYIVSPDDGQKIVMCNCCGFQKKVNFLEYDKWIRSAHMGDPYLEHCPKCEPGLMGFIFEQSN